MQNSSRLDAADTSFRLSDEQRRTIRPDFDPEALERLLQWVNEERRQELLPLFQFQGISGRTSSLAGLGDPFLQSLLDEVWQPYWDLYPTVEEIDREAVALPGKELAVRRRKGLPEQRIPPGDRR